MPAGYACDQCGGFVDEGDTLVEVDFVSRVDGKYEQTKPLGLYCSAECGMDALADSTVPANLYAEDSS